MSSLALQDVARLTAGSYVTVALANGSPLSDLAPAVLCVIRRDGSKVWADSEDGALSLRLYPRPASVYLVEMAERPGGDEKYVWWCACGASSRKPTKGTRAAFWARRSLQRHRAETNCQAEGSHGRFSDPLVRTAWGQVALQNIKRR